MRLSNFILYGVVIIDSILDQMTFKFIYFGIFFYILAFYEKVGYNLNRHLLNCYGDRLTKNEYHHFQQESKHGDSLDFLREEIGDFTEGSPYSFSHR